MEENKNNSKYYDSIKNTQEIKCKEGFSPTELIYKYQ